MKHTDYIIKQIPFPYDTVYAVAAINDKDGTCTIYENALCSDEQCEKSTKFLMGEIEKGAYV